MDEIDQHNHAVEFRPQGCPDRRSGSHLRPKCRDGADGYGSHLPGGCPDGDGKGTGGALQVQDVRWLDSWVQIRDRNAYEAVHQPTALVDLPGRVPWILEVERR
ncbi:MAG: hypothetical protein UV82_C0001G0001 [Candidatus Magasanikbacteria bacterium GW2011_GWD2_43_18]|nr:MAG: hypothetical protein UV18_C0001G0080 [Candidatus Magasanikbacteria bacterium GW2011_GWC2_42_27]KKT05212.1 MAG: hypothetical protein UV82_C0001G0001 [Candidatus Magasanikbacteria bacterium GW2011_GWD2_43_18]